jgi:tetratricopeptide (TPR) repeat protein
MLTELRNMLQVSRAVGRGDDSRVEMLCNSALARDADDTFALSVLANIYWRSEKYEQALPFALRVLDITPNDFEALRIVVHVYAARGDNAFTYRYAKCLCAAKPLISPPVRGLTTLLSPFAWMPKVRAVRARLASGMKREGSNSENWIAWARAYVLWYESQSPAA